MRELIRLLEKLALLRTWYPEAIDITESTEEFVVCKLIETGYPYINTAGFLSVKVDNTPFTASKDAAAKYLSEEWKAIAIGGSTENAPERNTMPVSGMTQGSENGKVTTPPAEKIEQYPEEAHVEEVQDNTINISMSREMPNEAERRDATAAEEKVEPTYVVRKQTIPEEQQKEPVKEPPKEQRIGIRPNIPGLGQPRIISNEQLNSTEAMPQNAENVTGQGASQEYMAGDAGKQFTQDEAAQNTFLQNTTAMDAQWTPPQYAQSPVDDGLSSQAPQYYYNDPGTSYRGNEDIGTTLYQEDWDSVTDRFKDLEGRIPLNQITYNAAKIRIYSQTQYTDINVVATPIDEKKVLYWYQNGREEHLVVSEERIIVPVQGNECYIKREDGDKFYLQVTAGKGCNVTKRIMEGGSGGHIVIPINGSTLHIMPKHHRPGNNGEAAVFYYLEMSNGGEAYGEDNSFSLDGHVYEIHARWEGVDRILTARVENIA